jgi:hypothetical protein
LGRYKSERGSYTIEASMIFSLIVLTVILLLFAFSYMQQKAYLESIASFAAQQGAGLWPDSRRSMENGAINGAKDADSLDYRLFDNLLLSQRTFEGYVEEVKDAQGKGRFALRLGTDNSLPGQKVLLIGEAVCKKMRGTVIRPDNTRVRVTYSNNIIRGKLSVEITQEIKVPLGGIKQFFDGKDTLTLSAQSEAAVSEPDEYIRNIDLALELYKKFEGKIDFEGIMDKVKAKKQK